MHSGCVPFRMRVRFGPPSDLPGCITKDPSALGGTLPSSTHALQTSTPPPPGAPPALLPEAKRPLQGRRCRLFPLRYSVFLGGGQGKQRTALCAGREGAFGPVSER